MKGDEKKQFLRSRCKIAIKNLLISLGKSMKAYTIEVSKPYFEIL